MPERQIDHPPLTVTVLDNICVSRSLNRIAAQIPVGKNGVSGAAFVRSVGVFASEHAFGMAVFGASLGGEEIIPIAYMIKVRRFDKTPARSLANAFRGG